MNKPIKILLLVVAIIVAIGGVMFFCKTRVAPPANLTFNNQYVGAVKNDIDKVNTLSSIDDANSSYSRILHNIDFQWKNTLLTDAERDDLLKSFVNVFAPTYAGQCDHVFDRSTWDEGSLSKIQDYIKDIQGLKCTDGSKCLASDGSLNRITDVITNYHKAKSIASASKYNGLQSAKETIRAAHEYANMSPLKNCTALKEKLNGVANRLNQSHVASLTSMVERLKNWHNYSEDSYDALAMEVSEKLKEYKHNARSVYGTASDISSLENRASTYYNNSEF